MEGAARARARSRRRSTRRRFASRCSPRASAACSASATTPARVLATRRRGDALPRAAAAGGGRERGGRAASATLLEHVTAALGRPLPDRDRRGRRRRSTATCSGDDLGLLIGKHGQTIDAVQALANAIVGRRRARSGRRSSSTPPATATAAAARSRRSRCGAPRRRCATGSRVELEPMSAGRAEARARAPEGLRRRDDGERRGRAESLRRRRAGLSDWLRAVVATPGLTALDLDDARRVLLEDSLRAVELVGAHDGPDRRRRLGRRRSRDPARARAAGARGRAARGRAAQVRLPRALGAAERARRLGPRRGAGAPTGPGVALAKALAPPPVAAEWCLPLVRPGGIAILWVGETAEPARVARGRRRGSRPSRPTSPPGLIVLRKLGPDAAGLPAPDRCRRRKRPAAPEATRVVVRRWRRPRAPLPSVRARPGLRVREPEGRRRQDDHRHQPRGLPRRGRRARRSSSTSTRRRTRPRGSGCARTAPRATTCSTALRSPSSRSRPRSRTSSSSRRSPSSPARRSSSSRRDDGERFLAEALADAERLRLRPARLPALARPADGERARGRRPRDRAGAGRVLRARGARAARAVDQPHQGAAEPAARGRAAC